MEWRRDFIRTYLERDIPQFGSRIPAETLRRFWTMLAHNQSQMLNAATLARGLGVDGKTVASYLDLLVDLLLVRRLPAWHRNVGKRLVKSPKAVSYTHLNLIAETGLDGERITRERGEADRARQLAEAAQAAFFTTTTQNHHE